MKVTATPTPAARPGTLGLCVLLDGALRRGVLATAPAPAPSESGCTPGELECNVRRGG